MYAARFVFCFFYWRYVYILSSEKKVLSVPSRARAPIIPCKSPTINGFHSLFWYPRPSITPTNHIVFTDVLHLLSCSFYADESIYKRINWVRWDCYFRWMESSWISEPWDDTYDLQAWKFRVLLFIISSRFYRTGYSHFARRLKKVIKCFFWELLFFRRDWCNWAKSVDSSQNEWRDPVFS